jgi:hypothetical protein
MSAKMASLFTALLESVLRFLGAFWLGAEKTKAKSAEAVVKATENAKKVATKVKLDSKYRDHIRGMFKRK